MLNPGIRKTVEWLRSEGFVTTDSGDGETNPAEGMEDALEFPHVIMVVRQEEIVQEAERLMGLLDDKGIEILPMSDDGSQPAIEATYDPADESAVLMLFGVDDKKLFPPS